MCSPVLGFGFCTFCAVIEVMFTTLAPNAATNRPRCVGHDVRHKPVFERLQAQSCRAVGVQTVWTRSPSQLNVSTRFCTITRATGHQCATKRPRCVSHDVRHGTADLSVEPEICGVTCCFVCANGVGTFPRNS